MLGTRLEINYSFLRGWYSVVETVKLMFLMIFRQSVYYFKRESKLSLHHFLETMLCQRHPAQQGKGREGRFSA